MKNNVEITEIQNKLENLLKEKDQIISEIQQLQQAYNVRYKRLIEINGSLEILNDLLPENNDIENNESN